MGRVFFFNIDQVYIILAAIVGTVLLSKSHNTVIVGAVIREHQKFHIEGISGVVNCYMQSISFIINGLLTSLVEISIGREPRPAERRDSSDHVDDLLGGYHTGAFELSLSAFVSRTPHIIPVIEVLSAVVPAPCAHIMIDDSVGGLELTGRQ